MQSSKQIKIKDLVFHKFIDEKQIQRRVGELGQRITDDYSGSPLLMIGLLNGAVVFMSDLIRQTKTDVECAFIKASSYVGTQSIGTVRFSSLDDLQLKSKHVLIVEDIVDSGLTMNRLLPLMAQLQPQSIKICALLHKPANTKVNITLDYVGFEIPDRFVVGYGLDYDGLGRNLPHLYSLKS